MNTLVLSLLRHFTLSVSLVVCLSVSPVELFVCLFVCSSVCLFVWLYCLSACLFGYLSVCLFVCLSKCLFALIYLFVCLPICPFLVFFLFVYLSNIDRFLVHPLHFQTLRSGSGKKRKKERNIKIFFFLSVL